MLKITQRTAAITIVLMASLFLLGGCSESNKETATASAPAMKAADAISVINAWIRAVPPSSPTTAAFMQLVNTDDAPHSLRTAKSPAAEIVELHTHTMGPNGMHQMRQVEEIPIAANDSAQLAPGGYHIMLINMVSPLSAGQSAPITLVFEDDSEIQLEVMVK